MPCFLLKKEKVKNQTRRTRKNFVCLYILNVVICRLYHPCYFQALFAAHGPGFKRQYNTTEPFEAIEVYNLMAGR